MFRKNCSTDDGDYGGEGVMWEIAFELPEDAKAGDVYPIDICYNSSEAAMDLFNNRNMDQEGNLMQAYTFTQGIFNDEYNPNFSAPPEDIEKCSALKDIGRGNDGYIAVADEENTTVKYPADGGFSAEEIAASPVKPVITVGSKVLSEDDISGNKKVEVDISVSGADRKYVGSSLRVYYDKRLTIPVTKDHLWDVKKGDALTYLVGFGPIDDPFAEDYDMKGVILSFYGDEDIGFDGVIWSITFVLPDDAKAGDVYPIDIVYKSLDTTGDVFINSQKDDTGKLMQAYTFTQGIYNKDYNCNFAASAEDTARCAVLSSLPGDIDGYIAVADHVEPPTEPPTEPPVESYPLGDVNNDGSVNASDASVILAEYARIQTGGGASFTPAQFKAADINGDLKVDSSDASDVLRFYAYTQTGGAEKDVESWLATLRI